MINLYLQNSKEIDQILYSNVYVPWLTIYHPYVPYYTLMITAGRATEEGLEKKMTQQFRLPTHWTYVGIITYTSFDIKEL